MLQPIRGIVGLARIERLDRHEGGNHQAELSRLQNGPITRDHATLLETPYHC